jgi:hypothetical protein
VDHLPVVEQTLEVALEVFLGADGAVKSADGAPAARE